MARIMETQARRIFRSALFHHYIDGIAAGDDVENWLKNHGGWFPDEQSDYGYGVLMPPSDGPEAMSTDPVLAIKEAKTLMDRLAKTLGEEENAAVLDDVCEWLEWNAPGSARDRSRSPLRIEPLSNAARAALDVVYHRDKEARVDDQRATIARLRQELAGKDAVIASKDAVIASLHRGIGVKMGPVWIEHGIQYPEARPNQDRRASVTPLHTFLAHLRSENAKLFSAVVVAGTSLPLEGEATESEDDDEEHSD
jgi:hypothetical protein